MGFWEPKILLVDIHRLLSMLTKFLFAKIRSIIVTGQGKASLKTLLNIQNKIR